MLASNESTTVKTAMMAKMPTVTPSSDRMVRNKLALRASQAKRKLSKARRRVSIIRYYYKG